MSKQTGTSKTGSGGTGKPANLDALKKDIAEPGLKAVKESLPDLTKGGIIGDLTKGEIVGDVAKSDMAIDTPGCEPISMKRWHVAQAAEREQHKMGHAEGILHYGKAYQHYFRFVGLGHNLHGLNVIEIGPADFPALQTCENFNGVIIEPMASEHLEQICREKGITLIKMPFESVEFAEKKDNGIREIWLFNVMQHVIDPGAFIEKCKAVADRIRYFEPINQPITAYHPHTYTLKDYIDYFGDCDNVVNLYAGKSVPGFHEADCAYGCWVKR